MVTLGKSTLEFVRLTPGTSGTMFPDPVTSCGTPLVNFPDWFRHRGGNLSHKVWRRGTSCSGSGNLPTAALFNTAAVPLALDHWEYCKLLAAALCTCICRQISRLSLCLLCRLTPAYLLRPIFSKSHQSLVCSGTMGLLSCRPAWDGTGPAVCISALLALADTRGPSAALAQQSEPAQAGTGMGRLQTIVGKIRHSVYSVFN